MSFTFVYHRYYFLIIHKSMRNSVDFFVGRTVAMLTFGLAHKNSLSLQNSVTNAVISQLGINKVYLSIYLAKKFQTNTIYNSCF